jgi:hypothetical protein
MASYPPPTEDLPIFDGSLFSTTLSSGITQEQADELYLQKNTPDTATALQTFDSGLSTNLIIPETSTDTLNIGGGFVNTGDISLNTGGAVLLTSTSNVSLGTDIGDINVGPVQSTGVINIGTAASRSGEINIGSGLTSTATINIGSGPGIINLGNNLSQIKIDGGFELTDYYAPSPSYLGNYISTPLNATVGTIIPSGSTSIYSTMSFTAKGIYLINATLTVAPNGGVQPKDVEFTMLRISDGSILARSVPQALANSGIATNYDYTGNLTAIFNKAAAGSEGVRIYVYLNYGGGNNYTVSSTAYNFSSVRIG